MSGGAAARPCTVMVEARGVGVDRRLSLLKVLASLAVIVVHTAVWRASQVDVHSLGWWMANVGDAAGRFGSAMFAMVAGAVLLGRSSEQAPWRFVGQRLGRLLPAVIFWSAFYFAWRQWMWGGVTAGVIARDLLLGSPWYHLWFLFMMLGLYCVLPAVRFAVLGVGEGAGWRYVVVVAALLTWCASAAQTLQGLSHASFLGLVPFFVVYLLAGYYFLRKTVRVPTGGLLGMAVLAVVCMAMGVAWSYPWLKNWAFVLFYSNRSPFAMALTFSLFLLVMRIPCERLPAWVDRLGASTLGVYAVHPFWIDMLARWGYGLSDAGSWWVGHTVFVYALSVATSLCLFHLPGARRLVS